MRTVVPERGKAERAARAWRRSRIPDGRGFASCRQVYNASMSDVARALEQIAEIHEHLAKGEVYRGWRSAAGGLVRASSAFWRPRVAIGDRQADRPLELHGLLAGGRGRVAAGRLFGNRLALRGARDARRNGGGRGRSSASSCRRWSPARLPPARSSESVRRSRRCCPGSGRCFFGVGIFSARPVRAARQRLGRALLLDGRAGAACGRRRASMRLSPWAVGGTFGVGQLLAAAVLYWNLERPDRYASTLRRHG